MDAEMREMLNSSSDLGSPVSVLRKLVGDVDNFSFGDIFIKEIFVGKKILDRNL